MPTNLTRSPRNWRRRWVLFYQDALGTPDDPVLEAVFTNEAAALAWTDTHCVVPLSLEVQDQLFGDNARLLGTIVERLEV